MLAALQIKPPKNRRALPRFGLDRHGPRRYRSRLTAVITMGALMSTPQAAGADRIWFAQALRAFACLTVAVSHYTAC